MRNAAWLDRQLSTFDGLRIIPAEPRATRHSYHGYQFRYDPEKWKGLPRDKFLAAVQAEGAPKIHGMWPLLNKMPLFTSFPKEGARACPVSCPFHQGQVQDYPNLRLPNAERVSAETGVMMVHSYLLGDESDMRDVVDIFAKVRENLDALLGAR